MTDEMHRLKIDILLHEYDSLREEILRRYDAQFQSIGVIAVVLVGLIAALAAKFEAHIIGILIVAALVIFFGIMVWADYDITRTARRLREIEADINKRAGERLLEWETSWGGGGGLGRVIANMKSRRPN